MGDTNIPNFDAMDADELLLFWSIHQGGRHARSIFPNFGKGTIRATADLANYASNKATAMQCRARGNVPAAQMYESICDRIYNDLPTWARW